MLIIVCWNDRCKLDNDNRWVVLRNEGGNFSKVKTVQSFRTEAQLSRD
jgi:hypothetical protein